MDDVFDQAKTEQLRALASAQPYPLLFATVSGAHLYGFPSADSDYDLRGVHILSLRDVVRLKPAREIETIIVSGEMDALEMDLVSHDIRKFFTLLLRKNGYVLEQLYSPLVVITTLEHKELKSITRGCITRHHAHHYLGFAQTQWKLFNKQEARRVKPLLYTFRVLLTGIHLMRSGEIEANLPRLNEGFKLPYINELVQRKVMGREKSVMDDADLSLYESEYSRLLAQLEEEYIKCTLPEVPSCEETLDNLLVRVRLNGLTTYRQP